MSKDDPDLSRPVLETARDLLGCELVRKTPEGTQRIRIVETEAYAEDDPASHSYNGPTPRSEIMFGPPGYWYVYKCYGIHWMLNVVCGQEGDGEAVLLRAGEPLEGEVIMEGKRGRKGVELTNGPGKLAEALAVDDSFDGDSVHSDDLYLRFSGPKEPVYESPRVGISEEKTRYWRFYLDNKYCSDVSQNDLGRRRN